MSKKSRKVKKQKTKNTKLTLAVIGLFLSVTLVVSLVFFVMLTDRKAKIEKTTSEEVSKRTEEPESKKEEELENSLVDLRGGNFEATLIADFDEHEGKNKYHLEAQNLTTPTEGESYEVWLRAESGVMMSLGDLNLAEDDRAFLDFNLNDELLDFYQTIIISHKKSEKEIPGTLVMEGALVKR